MAYKKKEINFIEQYAQIEKRNLNTLPRDLELERFVLGRIMISSFESDIAFGIIGLDGDNPFYSKEHSLLFDIQKKLFLRKEHPDELSIIREINKIEKSEITEEYVSALSETITYIHSDFAQGCRTLLEIHNRRKFIFACEGAILLGFENKIPLDELSEQTESKLLEVRTRKKLIDPSHISNITHSSYDVGYKFHIPEINELFCRGCGAQPQNFIIIGARPSTGKTTFAISQMVKEASFGNACLFFSGEMRQEDIAGKIFECFTGISAWKINPKYKDYIFTKEEQDKRDHFQKHVKDYNIYIDDSVGLTPLDIRGRTLRWKKKHDIKAVFVDYLQILKPTEKVNGRYERITAISEELKWTARDINLPFFVLSQLKRGDGETVRKPQLSDLRDSGSIEENADAVIFLYDPLMTTEGNPNKIRDVEIIVSKNRMGGLGSAKMKFETEISLFREWRADDIEQSKESDTMKMKTLEEHTPMAFTEEATNEELRQPF